MNSVLAAQRHPIDRRASWAPTIAAFATLFCVVFIGPSQAHAANTSYTFSGTMTFVSNYKAPGSGWSVLPEGVTTGSPFTGSLVFDDAVPVTDDHGTGKRYQNAVTELSVTVGGTTFNRNWIQSQYAEQAPMFRPIELSHSSWPYTPNSWHDTFRADLQHYNQSNPAFITDTHFMFLLKQIGTEIALPSTDLSGVELDLPMFSYQRQIDFSHAAYDSLSGFMWPDDYYFSWRLVGAIDVLSSSSIYSTEAINAGTVVATSGQQISVTTASGGVINASAGSAQIGTLDGATLNTGAAGATVTTLTSGVINTAGGSVTTQGGTFTGEITGNGGLTKTGTGTLVLNSANSFTGNTVINAGTVEIAVGDALGSGAAPIRIANNGKFKALAGVAVTKPVVISSASAIYEHVLGESDSLTNLAPISNSITTADIVAGDATATTFTSNFNGNGSISLHGLNGTKFLMVLDMEGYIPEDATLADTYLGWWDETANSGAGGWVNAVLGNIGTAGSLAGGYTTGYQQFLTANGGWDGTAMLGAYGLDLANQQVWAVIDHNSDFGVTNNGILVVPEPSSLALAGIGLAGGGLWLKRRRRQAARRGAA